MCLEGILMNISVSVLSKVMVGQETCLFKIWHRMRHKEKDETVSKKLALWIANHTKMVTDLSIGLKEGRLSREKWLAIEILKGTLLGKPDLIHVKDNSVTVYECKSGKRNEADCIQLLVYLYILDKLKPYGDKMLTGLLCYDTITIKYSVEDVPKNFGSQIEYYFDLLLNEEQPPRCVGDSCRLCLIDCDKRNLL